jgi:uncharacterized membrane protein YeiH
MIPILEFTAVITSCLFGILQARRYGMDFLGVFTVSFVTAFGGGSLRDVLLNREKLFWIEHELYLYVAFAVVVISSFLPKIPKLIQRHLYLPDAIGLGLFSIVGTQYALQAETGWLTASLFGVMTGAFGGVISDIICNEVPTIFRSAPLYATCSFAGCWVYILLGQTALPDRITIFAGFTVIVAIRLMALRFNITLPEYHDEIEPTG